MTQHSGRLKVGVQGRATVAADEEGHSPEGTHQYERRCCELHVKDFQKHENFENNSAGGYVTKSCYCTRGHSADKGTFP